MNARVLTRNLVAVSVLLVVLAGCGDTDTEGTADDQLCEEAEQHVLDCFPELEGTQPTDCDPDRAAQTLDQSCEELGESEGKADEPCEFWSPGSCEGGEGEPREIWIGVKECSSSVCGNVTHSERCAYIEIENAVGEVVYGGLTGQRSVLHLEDVPLQSGDYTLNLYDRDGELAEMKIEQDFQFGRPGRAEASKEITLEDGDDGLRFDFYVTDEQADELRRCARVEGELVSTCDGEPMDAEQTEWAWFVELVAPEHYPTDRDIIRPFAIDGTNSITFPDAPVGEYELDFHEMDIPESERENNPDYRALLTDYGTGRVVSESFEVTAEDVDETVSIGEVEIEHEQCE